MYNFITEAISLRHRGISLELFKNNLLNQRDNVRIGDSCSNYSVCNIGVLQGSILGPILINIFVNNICNVSDNITIILYGDNTILLLKNNSLQGIVDDRNRELEKFKTWVTANKLSLNTEKIHAMLVSNRLYQRDLVL